MPAVERELTADTLAKWLPASAGGADVKLWLPRFRVESRFDAGDALRALGVRAAFDPAAADFGGMLPPETGKVSVGKVIHRAFCEVAEEGTEAAAATAVTFPAPSPVPPPPKEFRADRPFAFLIRDARHGTVLFAGRYAGP